MPGAAATLARAAATPIPTPVHTPGSSPGTGPSPSAASGVGSLVASPSATKSNAEEQFEIARQQLERALATPELPGIETLLLNRVAMSTNSGGEVLDRQAAAAWLRERAGPGIRIESVERNVLAVMMGVVTEGWPATPPLNAGGVRFNFHRYDASGNQDQERGDWLIDVITAE